MKPVFPLVTTLLLAVFGGNVRAMEAIRIQDDTHLGVASCATSVCHGKLAPQESENVWLNEYRIWSRDDLHSNAYQVLKNDESKHIAAKLGLPSATGAKICLDCHTDNVPEDKRGPKFQISDGVGCEACHGGSARWIESHTEPGATHADNLARGMYPTEDPLARASICLSCHLGTKDQFATHRIMGAGHPRLVFELQAFTTNQPAHYEVDADYVERKGEITGFRMWVTGQLESAERYLELVGGQLFQPGGMFPELAFYDCHSCHHSMKELGWSTAKAGDVGPGSLRLQDQHLKVLAVITKQLDASAAPELERATAALVAAGQQNAAAVRARAGELLDWVTKRAELWSDRTFSDAEARQVRRALLAEAAAGRMADYMDAEQVFLAVESLSLHLGDADAHRQYLDALFDTFGADETYDSEAFRRAAARARDGFQ